MENLFLFRRAAADACGSRFRAAGFCVAAAALLSGCATQPTAPALEPVPAQTEAPAPSARIDSPAVKQLTADARAALQNAEQSVTQARAQQALWTSAVQTLEQARNAAKRFDNESVIRLSTQVNELVRLSLKQRQGPPLKLLN
jgi:hypothetical protein